MKQTDFKKILNRELESRMTRNPRYSLRAFAKDLKMAPAFVSDVLKGKRGLSRQSALKISKKLSLSVSESEHFCDLVESLHARSKAAKQLALQRLESRQQTGVLLKFTTLQNETFHLLSDWYHLALSECLKTNFYQNTEFQTLEEHHQWLAAYLKLSVRQVENAIFRMEEHRLIEKKNNKYFPTAENIHTPDGIVSEAMKIHHEQHLNKAIDAVYSHSLEERDFRGLTIKCSKKSVPFVREKIKTFLQELDVELTASEKNRDEKDEDVYRLSTQFFRLTHNHHHQKE